VGYCRHEVLVATLDSELRLAIVGCGAVVELCYLPTLRQIKLAPAVWVDQHLPRAEKYAAELGGRAVAEAGDALDSFDAAVLALPHHLHAPIGGELLRAGKHVLIEKPLATSSAECGQLLAAAEASGATLAVGHVRRFMPANRWVKAALDEGRLGALQSVDVREGAVFGWPAASGFFWQRETAGGGVLADTGAHVLDLLLWWLGRPETLNYQDDAMGGVEADALATWRAPGHVEVYCELSRTRDLRNTFVLRGEAGTVEVGCHHGRLTASPTSLLDGVCAGLHGARLPKPQLTDLFAAQLSNWMGAIAGAGTLHCPPREAAEAVGMIEACYAVRKPWLLPWVMPEPQAQVSP